MILISRPPRPGRNQSNGKGGGGPWQEIPTETAPALARWDANRAAALASYFRPALHGVLPALWLS